MIKLQNEIMSALILPEEGMNICELTYKENKVIGIAKERRDRGGTYGMPILYPTPGRTKDNQFTFLGKRHNTISHGYVRKLPFQVIKLTDTEVIGRLLWNKEQDKFLDFPYLHQLDIFISIEEKKLKYRFEITNLGNEKMGFGFGTHPYFWNGNKDAVIQLNCNYMLQEDEDKIPTGTLIPYEKGSTFKVSQVAFDSVFYKYDKVMATISYPNYEIKIHGDQGFNHMVVYTPVNDDYFCIEPQTSSTDPFNQYVFGKGENSGLQIVNPLERKDGEFYFQFSDAKSMRNWI